MASNGKKTGEKDKAPNPQRSKPTIEAPVPVVDSEIVLGRRYRDSVTGLIGIAVSWSFHLNGCRMVVVEPQVADDNKVSEKVYSYDEGRLVEVDEQGNDVKKVLTAATRGGPRSEAPSAR